MMRQTPASKHAACKAPVALRFKGSQNSTWGSSKGNRAASAAISVVRRATSQRTAQCNLWAEQVDLEAAEAGHAITARDLDIGRSSALW
eukprot:gene24393-10414_t